MVCSLLFLFVAIKLLRKESSMWDTRKREYVISKECTYCSRNIVECSLDKESWEKVPSLDSFEEELIGEVLIHKVVSNTTELGSTCAANQREW